MISLPKLFGLISIRRTLEVGSNTEGTPKGAEEEEEEFPFAAAADGAALLLSKSIGGDACCGARTTRSSITLPLLPLLSIF